MACLFPHPCQLSKAGCGLVPWCLSGALLWRSTATATLLLCCCLVRWLSVSSHTQIQEAMLTGESVPVSKTLDPVKPESGLVRQTAGFRLAASKGYPGSSGGVPWVPRAVQQTWVMLGLVACACFCWLSCGQTGGYSSLLSCPTATCQPQALCTTHTWLRAHACFSLFLLLVYCLPPG